MGRDITLPPGWMFKNDGRSLGEEVQCVLVPQDIKQCQRNVMKYYLTCFVFLQKWSRKGKNTKTSVCWDFEREQVQHTGY